MKLLITTHGGAGHFHPLAPIADAVLARGHEVTFATEPPYDGQIRVAGYAVEPVGRSFDFTDPERTFPGIGRRRGIEGAIWTMEHVFYGALARAALPDVERLIREWRPDVVLTEASEVAGLLAAERHGIPHATFGYSGLDPSVMQLVAGPAWARLRAEVGLPPDDDFTALTDDLLIVALPARWAGDGDVGHVRRVRLTPRHGIDGTSPAADHEDGQQHVYGTLGTVNRDRTALRELVEGLGLVGAPALVTTGAAIDPSEVDPVPGCVQVRRYAPHSEVIPSATAVVHHAGFNTLLDVLRAGLPQVMLPMDADQPLNAARAAELGLGLTLDPGTRSPETIAAGVERVLTDASFLVEAAAMRRDLDALDPVTHVVDDLTALADAS